MKIDALSVSYNLQGTKISNKNQQAKNQPTSVPGMSVITFRGGNKNQVIYWGMELRPYSSLGGISTVLRDHRGLELSKGAALETNDKKIEYWKQPDKVFVDPLYNGMEVYEYDTGLMQEARVGRIPEGLDETSAFKKYEGKLFYTSDEKFKTYPNELEFFKNEEKVIPATGKPKLAINTNIHILEQVGEPMSMDFGGANNGETMIRLFRVHRFDQASGKLVPINDFKVMTDVSATWKKPYEGGGYATADGALAQAWKGDGDARSSKAFVKFIKRICEEVSKDGKEFKPATILLNDSHAANVVEYLVQETVNGNDKFLAEMKPELIAHNLGMGYIQETSYQNMFVNIADKELRDAVKHDPNYIEALMSGNDAVERYFRKLLPSEMVDKRGQVSPFQNAVYYADKGFVPKIITVSEGYHDATITNPDLVPGQFEQLKKLADKDVYIGITNGSTGIDPYKADGDPYFKGYTFPNDIDGIDKVKGRVLPKYEVFDKELAGKDPAKFNIEHVREVKRHNKAALLERFDEDILEALKTMKNIEGKEYEYAAVIAAKPDRQVEVLGHIDKKFIDAAKAPDKDVKLLISWGRGDTQKGLDSVLRSFTEYAEKYAEKDPNVVLVAGGEIPDNEEGKALKAIIEKMNNNPKTKGRFVFLNGFAPNKPLIMAGDFAVLPSRFAPCELTDLESIKGLCPPIVTNCQGLGQKNFDATFVGEADKVTGYKTKHEFYMSLEELRSLLKGEDKENLEKDLKKLKDEIAQRYKLRFNKVLSDAEIMEKIKEERHYDFIFKITRPYRDKIIESELVDAYVRALQTDYHQDIQTKMIQNDVKLGINWEENAELSKFKKSSGQLYREAFQQDAKKIKEEDTLLYKLKQNCKEILEKYKKSQVTEAPAPESVEGIADRLNAFFHTKNGKYAAAGAAVAALAGLVYCGHKAGIFSSSYNQKDAKKHLSCVG